MNTNPYFSNEKQQLFYPKDRATCPFRVKISKPKDQITIKNGVVSLTQLLTGVLTSKMTS